MKTRSIPRQARDGEQSRTILALAIIVLLAGTAAEAKYSGGTGEPNDPYQIGSGGDLLALAADTNDYGKCFILTADIDLQGQVWTTAIIAADTSSSSGFQGTAFTGTFDGNGHKINHFTINGGDYLGLFGEVNTGGSVKNLSLENCLVSGGSGSSYVGGLVGDNYDTISNCYSTGPVSGYSAVGGLVGRNCYGSINNCYSTGSVSGYSGSSNVGGLVGENDGSISQCYSTGTVTGSSGSDCVGGLVGYSDSIIIQCYSTGAVSGSSDVGGLVGINWGSIRNCYSRGTVSSYGYVGGLVGENYGGSICDCYSTGSVSGNYHVGGLVGRDDGGSVSDCYSTGTVSGSNSLGGLVGYNGDGSISNCYSTGAVGRYDADAVGGLVGENYHGNISNCYSTGAVSGFWYVGGLVGDNGGSVVGSFWDTETSGQPTSAGGTGKTTVEMKTMITFTDAGWNFFTIWDIVEGQTYPFFKSVAKYSGGTGTPDDPYRIATAEDLLHLADTPVHYGKCFVLTADIDMEGQVFTTAIIAPDTSSSVDFQGTAFTGTFDGNSHKITHFTIDGGSNEYLGLFGYIGTGGVVRNLGVKDVNITGYSAVGGLVGYSRGTISTCYATGAVSGDSWSWHGSGGLVGANNQGTITDCYATGSVSGGSSNGGLVGRNYQGNVNACYSTGVVDGHGGLDGGLVGSNFGGTISTCYATGAVTGGSKSSYVGGLVGANENEGTITDCYATGAVSGGSYVGGLVGGWNDEGSISACYATGAVSGNYYVGGLVGLNYGTITNCYSAGSVAGSSYVGGLMGQNNGGSISGSFWDTQTSGQPTSAGGTGKTTVEMKMMGTFTDAGWDFVGEIENGTEDIWDICEGTNYPRLRWQIPAADWVCPDGVNMEDLSYFVERWLLSDCASSNNCGGADMDSSGTVDFADFAILASHWLEGTGP